MFHSRIPRFRAMLMTPANHCSPLSLLLQNGMTNHGKGPVNNRSWLEDEKGSWSHITCNGVGSGSGRTCTRAGAERSSALQVTTMTERANSNKIPVWLLCQKRMVVIAVVASVPTAKKT